MSEFYTKHYYKINSKDKLSQTDNSTSFRIRNHKFNKVISFSIKDILIPYTFYPINSTNNELKIIRTGNPAIVTITIPPGNYTLSRFLVAFKIALDLPGTFTYTITAGDTNNKLTITQNASTFTILSSGSLNRIIGFSTTENLSSVNPAIAPNVYNLSGINNIYIFSNELTKFDTRVRTSGPSDSGLLLAVDISNSSFGQNIYQHFEHMSFDYHSHSESDIDIELKDYYGNYLGGNTALNGQDISLNLQFHTLSSNDDLAMNKSSSKFY